MKSISVNLPVKTWSMCCFRDLQAIGCVQAPERLCGVLMETVGKVIRNDTPYSSPEIRFGMKFCQSKIMTRHAYHFAKATHCVLFEEKYMMKHGKEV